MDCTPPHASHMLQSLTAPICDIVRVAEAKIAALDKQLEPVRTREHDARDKVRDLEKVRDF